MDEPEIAAPALAEVFPINRNGRHPDLAETVRVLRLRGGLSQSQLALRLSWPRTYVSKIENRRVTPLVSSLERLAKALKVGMPELLAGGDRSRQDELRELTDDRFIRGLLPFVGHLSRVQMTTILARAADLTAEQSRCRIVR